MWHSQNTRVSVDPWTCWTWCDQEPLSELDVFWCWCLILPLKIQGINLSAFRRCHLALLPGVGRFRRGTDLQISKKDLRNSIRVSNLRLATFRTILDMIKVFCNNMKTCVEKIWDFYGLLIMQRLSSASLEHCSSWAVGGLLPDFTVHISRSKSTYHEFICSTVFSFWYPEDPEDSRVSASLEGLLVHRCIYIYIST